MKNKVAVFIIIFLLLGVSMGCISSDNPPATTAEKEKDRDWDGVPDKYDDCPDEWGTVENHGCPESQDTPVATPPLKDTDGDGVADIYDSCPYLYGTDNKGCPVTTVPPATYPPNEQGNYIRVFNWDYGDYEWTYELTIPKSTYNYYNQQPRYSVENFVYYVVDDESGIVELISNELTGTASEEEYTEWETIYFVISFVQGLPYYPDDISSGHDEWPKYPVETIADGGGDCEDTSILVAALLNYIGYDVVLFELETHMAVGVWCTNCDGSYVEHNGKQYYYLETTGEGWNIGEFPSDFENEYIIVREIPT